ncbi:MAG: nucleotide exchange factor GrpE [Draconibacterium sp.]|nr:MAG: nucleotide exchange factor GrpE [Draconibacterium sp.]
MDHEGKINEGNIEPEEDLLNNPEETEGEEEGTENSPDMDKSHSSSTEKQLKEANEKLVELTDRHLRLQAEFDNFRKRTMKEKAEIIKSAGESLLINILPVVDDFQRALESMKNIPDDDSGKQGTMLIYNKFLEFLKQNNIKEIDALHKNFEVELHEAITKLPVKDKKLKGKVIEVIQKGYLLNDKVIRFAKVVVGE